MQSTGNRDGQTAGNLRMMTDLFICIHDRCSMTVTCGIRPYYILKAVMSLAYQGSAQSLGVPSFLTNHLKWFASRSKQQMLHHLHLTPHSQLRALPCYQCKILSSSRLLLGAVPAAQCATAVACKSTLQVPECSPTKKMQMQMPAKLS